MISAVRRASTPHVRVYTSRFIQALASTRSFSIDKSLTSKEKVEEDRYIRAREKQILESKLRAAEAAAHSAELADANKAKIAALNATMHELADLLAKTGDVVSEEGLANLAAWKHG